MTIGRRRGVVTPHEDDDVLAVGDESTVLAVKFRALRLVVSDLLIHGGQLFGSAFVREVVWGHDVGLSLAVLSSADVAEPDEGRLCPSGYADQLLSGLISLWFCWHQ